MNFLIVLGILLYTISWILLIVYVARNMKKINGVSSLKIIQMGPRYITYSNGTFGASANLSDAYNFTYDYKNFTLKPGMAGADFVIDIPKKQLYYVDPNFGFYVYVMLNATSDGLAISSAPCSDPSCLATIHSA